MKSNLKSGIASALLMLLLVSSPLYSQQSVSIGDPAVKSNAILYLKGNGSQGIIIPIVSSLGNFGEAGMVVFNSSDKKVYYHDGSAWAAVGGSSGDNIVGNEVSQAGSNGALVLTGTGTAANPLTVSMISGTANGQVLKWNSTTSKWELGTDNTGASGLSSTLTSANFFVGNASNIAAGVPMSGDATLTNTGAVTIANNAVTSAKIADLSIMNADVNAAAAIAGTKIAPNFGSQLISGTGGLNTAGTVTFPALAGTGSRMVVADPTGVLGTQSIPATFSEANRVPKGNGTQLTGSLIYDNGTNVGVGTASPGHQLDVVRDNNLVSATDVAIRAFNPSATSGVRSGIRFQTGSGWAVQLQTIQDGNWLQLTNNAGGAVHRWGFETYYPSGSYPGYIQGVGAGIALMGGSVGIGTTAPTSALHVVGDIRFTGNYLNFYDGKFIFHGDSYTVVNDHWIPNSSSSYDLGTTAYRWRTLYTNTNPNVSSDLRLKRNIKDLNYGLTEILKLRPVSYYFKSDKEPKLTMGLIAQEVRNVIPEIVIEDQTPEKYLGVTYSDLIPVLINAIQEQQKQLDAQKTEVSRLREQLSAERTSSAEVEKLRAEIAEIKRLLGTEAKSGN